jgi:sugar lactone lactonase YvrE
MVVILTFLATFASAEGTRTWEQSKFDDLTKGTAKGVAIRSAGGLEMAPAFKALYTTPSTYIWAIAADDAGNIYAAAGAPARIYRVTPAGQATIIFEPQELQVQALAVAKDGVIYAATSPDGKIYKVEHKGSNPAAETKQSSGVDSSWSASVFFDPDTKYIWDLALDKSGNLYAATGDRGEIYRVTPKGDHSVFFKSDEAHIRVLAVDPQGNLIAGSDGSGLVYRISPAGEGFVLYSAPKKEITALAIDGAGNIYAAGVGEKRPGGLPTPFSMPGMQPPAPSATVTPQQPGTVTVTGPNPPPVITAFPAAGMGATGGSDIYRIAPDGSPTRVWSSREDIVYALDFDQQGHLLAGTGNRGHLFALAGEDEYTDLVKASATQITAFAKAPGGGLYASTSNLGKLFLLGPGPETEGSYESDIFDAHNFSRWGRADFRGTGNVELFARSGNVDNPDRNWSLWKKVDLQKGAEVSVPPARFVQWKAVLHAGQPASRVDSVQLNYLPKNVAPDFDDVNVQVGVRYQAMPKPIGVDSSAMASVPPPQVRDSNSIGARWNVHDDNDDQMEYSIYYRGDGESRWLLLKDHLTDKFYSFDAALLPDGGYTIKVVASDAPSHSPGEALAAEKESARFEVDTTPPQIEGLAAAVEGGNIHVSFHATDSFSTIKRAEYSIDADDWKFVEPVGQLSDAKTESYDFRAATPAGQAQLEHVVVVRVSDRYDNLNSAKFVIKGK